VATRAQKRSTADNSSPLDQSGILQHVLSYVGPGHWLFLSTVSSLWRELYGRVPGRQMQTMGRITRYLIDRQFTCVPQMTLYSSFFASPSRLRLAHQSGVSNATERYQHAAGRHATIEVLLVARGLGMPFSVSLMQGATRCNQLPVLQFLREHGCPWSDEICLAAARRGNLEILRWLRENGCPWNNREILSGAASSGNLEITTWVK
jgi:hypothetical protein